MPFFEQQLQANLRTCAGFFKSQNNWEQIHPKPNMTNTMHIFILNHNNHTVFRATIKSLMVLNFSFKTQAIPVLYVCSNKKNMFMSAKIREQLCLELEYTTACIHPSSMHSISCTVDHIIISLLWLY